MPRRPTVYFWIFGLAIALVVAIVPLSHVLRETQYRMSQQDAMQYGCSLGLDLVEGDYVVGWHGDKAATDETIKQVVGTLKKLPTGFTLIGPGEGRLFRVSVSGPAVTDLSIDRICELPLASLTVKDSPITDAIVAKLEKQHDLTFLTLDDTGVSKSAIASIRATHPKATILVNGDWVAGDLSQSRPR